MHEIFYWNIPYNPGCAKDPYDDETTWKEYCRFYSNLELGDVEDYIKSLSSSYNKNTYDGLRNNCQYFVKDLLKKLYF